MCLCLLFIFMMCIGCVDDCLQTNLTLGDNKAYSIQIQSSLISDNLIWIFMGSGCTTCTSDEVVDDLLCIADIINFLQRWTMKCDSSLDVFCFAKFIVFPSCSVLSDQVHDKSLQYSLCPILNSVQNILLSHSLTIFYLLYSFYVLSSELMHKNRP